MKLAVFRRITQGVTFTVFFLLFLLTSYPYPGEYPVDFILRLDPLVAVVTMIGSGTIIVTMLWAITTIVISLIFGRVFCGYICPLGTLIDFFDWVFLRKPAKKENNDPKPNRNIKYFILIGVLLASFAGANVLHFLSPMSIVPRFFTVNVFPNLLWFTNFLLDTFRPVADFLGLDGIASTSFQPYYYSGGFIIFLLTSLIFIANVWRKRFWCRYVCPTGAFISLFSRFGLAKRSATASSCTSCNVCNSVCDMRAVDEVSQNTIMSECTLCGNCTEVCTTHDIKIGFSWAVKPKLHDTDLLVNRRKFIYSGMAGLVSATVLKAGLHNRRNMDGRYVRPPGSVEEDKFLAQCIRCSECMKVCPTNALQPSSMIAGMDTVWTPRLVPRSGACEEKCNLCGQVCPTQAIRKLPLKEKSYVKLGTAVIDRHRCVAWEQEQLCLICDEICPYDAIEFKINTTYTATLKRPFVLEDKCTGCGWCENKCPTYGRGAIEIYSIGEERKSDGRYMTAKKVELRKVKENSETQYSASDIGGRGENTKMAVNTGANKKAAQQVKEPEEKIPGGFIVDEPEEQIPGGFILDDKE